MKSNIALLLAGLVAGVLIASLVPAQAHHGGDFRTLNRKVRQLQAKTQALDTNGLYYGPIVAPQVISFCEDGATATWEQIPVAGFEDLRALVMCDEEVSSPQDVRQYARHLLKSLKR